MELLKKTYFFFIFIFTFLSHKFKAHIKTRIELKKGFLIFKLIQIKPKKILFKK